MSEILRVYNPAECEPDGDRRPLDWERCRACMGTGDELEGSIDVPLVAEGIGMKPGLRKTGRPCATCGGHGSLRAAALAMLRVRIASRIYDADPDRPADAPVFASLRSEWAERLAAEVVVRCEGCGHPMHDKPWGDNGTGQPLDAASAAYQLEQALVELQHGSEPDTWERLTHWSPCDEGCRHEGPGRVWFPGKGSGWHYADELCQSGSDATPGLLHVLNGEEVQASWRPVGVRTLGWPHDLRPERLAVLCLRCLAERGEL